MRGILVHPTYQPTKAKLDEPITLPPMSPGEAASGSLNRPRLTPSKCPDARVRTKALGTIPHTHPLFRVATDSASPTLNSLRIQLGRTDPTACLTPKRLISPNG